jgi:hypothetical protein
MSFFQVLNNAREEAQAIGVLLNGKMLKSDLRSRLALGCFAIAQQHHSGIIILLSHQPPLQASAFAMLRSLAEAMFRGFWIAKCASDEKLKNILTGDKKQIDMATIIRDLIEAVGHSAKHEYFYKKVWPRLSAYTHTYEESLLPWLRGPDIDGQYSEDEQITLLKNASLVASLIVLGVDSLSAKPPLNALT